MATKWSILEARYDEAVRQAAALRRQLNDLEVMPCGLRCTGCDLLLETEADFARHFTVPDSRYLNLGSCPVKDEHRRASNG